MPLLTDVDCVLDYEEFFERQGPRLRRPAVAEAARWAVAKARDLIDPAILWEWLPVEDRHGGQVAIGGKLFKIGHHARLIAPASLACVCAFTIGPRLEERAKQLAAEGESFRGYMLDEAGILGLAGCIRVVRRMIEEEAAQRGWHVSPELAVGDTAGWSFDQLRLLCELMDIESAGISITQGGMLSPRKTGCTVVGIGPNFTAATVQSSCDFCSRGETCEYRE